MRHDIDNYKLIFLNFGLGFEMMMLFVTYFCLQI